jgi:myo-inositol-1(or 4)-monophosphatase
MVSILHKYSKFATASEKAQVRQAAEADTAAGAEATLAEDPPEADTVGPSGDAK